MVSEQSMPYLSIREQGWGGQGRVLVSGDSERKHPHLRQFPCTCSATQAGAFSTCRSNQFNSVYTLDSINTHM